MNFNKQNYKLILQTAINQGFEFVDFSTVNLEKYSGKQIILRHDIDYSLELAHEMAEIDAIYKIKSTFAVLISSPLYNPFTYANIKIINGIHSLGHNIVLHYYRTSGQVKKDMVQDINRAFQFMKVYLPYIQPVFIFHNPSLFNSVSEIKVPKLINAYSNRFTKDMFYISDSVLRNTPEILLGALVKQRLIHLLLHPLIWMSEQDNMTSMMSYVLTKIICECDKEFAFNGKWREKYPHGIPQEFLERIQQILNVRGISCSLDY